MEYNFLNKYLNKVGDQALNLKCIHRKDDQCLMSNPFLHFDMITGIDKLWHRSCF